MSTPTPPLLERTCSGGSLWEPYRPEPTDPKTAQEHRVESVEGRLVEMLMDHGVEPQDAHLLLPLPWQMRKALRRQQIREVDAALHADPTVCDMNHRGCPTHGETLRWSRWRRTSRCRERGCSYRIPDREWWSRHCNHPAVGELPVPGGDPDEQQRVCAGHRETQLLMLEYYAGRGLLSVEQLAALSSAGDDTHDEATE